MHEQKSRNFNEEKSSDSGITFTYDPDEKNKWGYDLYPERNPSPRFSPKDYFLTDKYRNQGNTYRCEKTVVKMLKSNPLLKVMTAALKKSGCPVNPRRHISCEYCKHGVTGGFDPSLNQIVICCNHTSGHKGIILNVLFHEFIHMYDYCVHNLDFKNPYHVACTEVRAANLTYCSYISALFGKNIPWFRLKARQQQCVRDRAVQSLFTVRDISIEEARKIVNEVFPKCYRDQEPIGRRLRRGTMDPDLVYTEAFIHGYE